ncbi:MAG: phosphoadenosine phosphosulfate reductase family protein [Coprococcus phoceensis]
MRWIVLKKKEGYFQQSNGQLALFQPDFIRDADCTKETPVIYGKSDIPIYGTGKRIHPRVSGRKDTEYMKKMYLEELLPLEMYDLVIVLISGGKDSIACYYKLLELGVPKSKIEFWHHDIDGGHPSRTMDWRCTANYIRSFAEAEQIPLRVSWRKNGFFGELYRIGASELIEYVDPETGEIYQCPPSKKYMECQKLKVAAISEMENKLAEFGYRMKFPMKSGDLSRRWCSAYLKIMVADTVLRNMNSVAANLTKTRKDIKLLIVSGERRGESVGRSKYNEIEIHRTNAVSKHHRTVHQWRPVIDYSEKDIWEVLKRHKVNPHPCYRAGWNRCSCAMCIFSTPQLFAGIRELYPKEYALLCQDEKVLGFTLDNHCDLETYIGSADSCVYHDDKEAIQSLLTGEFPVESVYVKDKWKYPAGAFHGAAGGPC